MDPSLFLTEMKFLRAKADFIPTSLGGRGDGYISPDASSKQGWPSDTDQEVTSDIDKKELL